MLPMQIDLMTEAVREMITKFFNVLPNFFTAVLIFIVGWIVSSMVAKMLATALSKMGVDRIGQRLSSIDIVQKSNINVNLSKIISKIVYYFLLIFFAIAATSALGLPEVSELMSNIFEFIPHVVVALIILIIGTLVSDAVRTVVHTALKSLGVGSANLISSAVFYFLFINVVISALSQAKIDTEFLSQNLSIVIGGVVLAFAIGYGLASKDTVANLLASYYSKNVFNIGDHVTIDNVTGKISEVNKSSIVIDTGSSRVVIPLSNAISQKIEFHN